MKIVRSAGGQSPDFLRLWAGQTVSLFGSRVTNIALPLTAVLTLHASAVQMGILAAIGSLAYLLVGLPAGVWVDRLPARRIMLLADLGRAVLLVSIPAAALEGVLTLAQVYAVAACTGVLTVFFDVAQQSLVPAIVPARDLVGANSRLEASDSVAQIAGPGIGGFLVQALTAPVAIAVDAASFVLSGAALLLVHAPPAEPVRATDRRILSEIREGLAIVFRHAGLRSLAAASATFNVFDDLLFAVYVLYMSRVLHLDGAHIGLVFGLGGLGGLLGAVLAVRLTGRFGPRRVMIAGIGVGALGELSIVGATGTALVATTMLIVAEGLVELGDTVYGINAMSLRQALTPAALRGRVNGTMRVLTWGVGSGGALVGGAIGQAFGLRTAVLIAGLGTLLSILCLLGLPRTSIPPVTE